MIMNEDEEFSPLFSTKAHASTVDHVVKVLNTDLQKGLSAEDAKERLVKYGRNKLKEAPPPTFLRRLFDQLNQTLIIILLISAIVSGGLQSWPEFGLILLVVVINVSLGLIQEGKASSASAALKNMLSAHATVVRDGVRIEIEAECVVPGDIVFIESGNTCPCDIRLFELSNLNIQESMLTGESLPVKKNLLNLELNNALGDRKNMCYSATQCVKGQGFGICIGTGDNTEIGRISTLVSTQAPTKTHLMLQVDAFGRWIGFIVLPISVATFAISYTSQVSLTTDASVVLTEGERVEHSFVIAVAIAVSMIPAGLPAIMTICMSLSTTYLAKKGAIVKALPSVETLGSVMVICSDKTGTLTKNEMTVVQTRTLNGLYNVTGVGYDSGQGKIDTLNEADVSLDKLLMAGILNNESRIDYDERKLALPVGDPSECALLCLSKKGRNDLSSVKSSYERIGIIPFESAHKFMVTFHRQPNNTSEFLCIVKGAPDRLLPRCNTSMDKFGTLQSCNEKFWKEQVELLSSNGYRVLALCQTTLSSLQVTEAVNNGPSYVSNREKPAFLTLLGLVAILDPPRESCIGAIKEAHRAGIIVKMITGDHPGTARSIAKSLGIVDDDHLGVLTGPELDSMTQRELRKVVLQVNVFARASPENKISIVKALKALNKVSSMTGDGVNDAPALRAADIGVAMGITGSDVSKDAAKIVLADDNFATIIVAVKEGRRVWDNLIKVLLYNMPPNFSQGGTIFIAVCLQWSEVPLTAIQVLYVNMITACSLGLVLVLEPAESTIMDKPPRAKTKGLIGALFYWRNIYASTMITSFVLGSVSWIKSVDPILYPIASQRAQAMNVLVFCSVTYVFNCRFVSLSSLHPRVFRGNVWVWPTAFLMGGLNVLLTEVPGLNTFFSMQGMDGFQWGIVVLFAILSFLVVELEKALSKPFRPFTQPIIRKMKNITCCNCWRSKNDPLYEEDDDIVVPVATPTAESQQVVMEA
jgi:magnesium-transporting ATPase (P-type)